MVVVAGSGVCGLILGSFLTVVIHRVPRRESIIRPRSHCPHCDHELAWFENLPVLSWVGLHGRCRNCSERISFRYPIVEIVTSTTFVAVALSIGTNWVLPAYLLFAAVLVALSGIDIDTRKIPNRLLYPSGLVGAALLAAGALLDGDVAKLPPAAAGACLGFALLFVVWFVAPGGMGYGDVRFSAYLGLHLGYLSLGHVGVALFVGFLLGAVVGLALMVADGRGRKSKIPFGPFLAAGAIFAVVVGDAVIDAYLGL